MNVLPRCKTTKPVNRHKVVSIPKIHVCIFAFPCIYRGKKGIAFAQGHTGEDPDLSVVFKLEDGTIETRQFNKRKLHPHTNIVVEHHPISDSGRLLGLALYVVWHHTYFAAQKIGSNRYLLFMSLVTKDTSYSVHYRTAWHRYRAHTVYLTEHGKPYTYVISFRQHWHRELFGSAVLARRWVAHMWLC